MKCLIKSSVWKWLLNHISSNALPFYLSQKLFLVLILVFRHHFLSDWQTFFEDIFSLVPSNTQSSASIEMFLQIGFTIHQEVVDPMIPRSANDTERNTLIKDLMRERAIPQLINTFQSLFKAFYANDTQISKKCLQLVGYFLNIMQRLYVSWVDINLVLIPEFMAGLYASLMQQNLSITACECISEIVLKGMPKSDKLNLLQLMNVAQLLKNLHHSQCEMFDEAVAKLVNNIGLELCFCYQESKTEIDKERSLQFLGAIFPYLLDYLSNEYDDTITALLPFLAAFLLLLKRFKRETGNKECPLLSNDNLLGLISVLVKKLKYDEEESYNFGPDASEDEALFLVCRF